MPKTFPLSVGCLITTVIGETWFNLPVSSSEASVIHSIKYRKFLQYCPTFIKSLVIKFSKIFIEYKILIFVFKSLACMHNHVIWELPEKGIVLLCLC
jgi:hypothetical protein